MARQAEAGEACACSDAAAVSADVHGAAVRDWRREEVTQATRTSGVHTPLDYAMRGLVWAALEKAHVFKTLYRTVEGEWTEDLVDADWYHWNNKPSGNLCADTKHEAYWIIGDKRYEDECGIITGEAFWAMYDELFCKPAVVPVLEAVVKERRRHERTVTRLTMRYDCEMGVVV